MAAPMAGMALTLASTGLASCVSLATGTCGAGAAACFTSLALAVFAWLELVLALCAATLDQLKNSDQLQILGQLKMWSRFGTTMNSSFHLAIAVMNSGCQCMPMGGAFCSDEVSSSVTS